MEKNSHESNKHLIGTSYACNNQQTSREEKHLININLTHKKSPQSSNYVIVPLPN
jgi:hypothetical protein